jgi:tetratricopeptide (TPR) repeat protein
MGLLVTTRAGGVRFRHALVRDAVARAVPAAQRRTVHGAAVRHYRGTRALPDVRRLPLLARHSAEAGLREEAAGLYLQLAEEARERHAYLDAELSYSKVLDLLPADDLARRLAARRGRGSMRYRIGRYEDSFADLAEARSLARQLADRVLEADILLDASIALDWTTDFVRSRLLVDEAEALAGEAPDGLLRARILLGKGRALVRASRRAEACAALEEAARLAEGLGTDAYETLIISLILLEGVLPEIGRIDDADRISQRAIALARDRGDRLHLASALNNRRTVRIARKDVSGACEDQHVFMRIGRELGIVLSEYFGEWNLNELLYQSGDLEGALEHGRRAMQIESAHPEVSHAPIAVLNLARLEAYRGREAEARELLGAIESAVQRAKDEGRASGALNRSEQVMFDMVDLATRNSTPDEWEELLERSARDSVEQEPIEVADLYGTWALRRGRMQEARRAFEEAAARAARIPNIMDARVKRGLAATAERAS